MTTGIDPQIVVDSNEALPQHHGYRFTNDRVCKLDCADYSGWLVLDRLRIERKSLADLLNCVGSRRDDFERGTLRPMLDYPHRYLVLEFTLQQIAAGGWSVPRVNASAAIGSIFAWSIRYGVHPIFAGDAAHGRAAVARIVKLVTNAKAADERLARARLADSGTDSVSDRGDGSTGQGP